MTTLSTVLTAVLSAVGGGGLAAWLNFKFNNRKQEKEEFEAVVEQYKAMLASYQIRMDKHESDIENLIAEVNNLKGLLNTKEMEIQHLRDQLLMLEASTSEIPLPMWLKDTQGYMLSYNSEYQIQIMQSIGKTQIDYIGKQDSAVWGAKEAQAMKDTDRRVIIEKRPLTFNRVWVGKNGYTYTARIIKYPRFIGNVVVGVGGIITDLKIENGDVKHMYGNLGTYDGNIKN